MLWPEVFENRFFLAPISHNTILYSLEIYCLKVNGKRIDHLKYRMKLKSIHFIVAWNIIKSTLEKKYMRNSKFGWIK